MPRQPRATPPNRKPGAGRPAPSGGPQTPNPKANAGPPPPGLDQARHASAQRAAHQAEVIREGVFPALMASALNIDKFFDTGAYRVFLAGVLRDLGGPTDPVERMLVEQLCLAHFRVAQLHAGAGKAAGLEATKLLNAVAARMLGEMRRTALSLKAYRTPAVPSGRAGPQVKLLKAAQ